MRLPLAVLAIAALCSCAHQQAEPVAAQPEEEANTQQSERPVFESQLNLFRQVVSESGIAVDVERPWFGHRSRIERMEALWKRGVLSDDDFALILISEYEKVGLLRHTSLFSYIEDYPYEPAGSAYLLYGPREHILDLLGDLMLEGSYTAVEGMLLLGVDGALATQAHAVMWMTMEKHPGLVTEVMLTSPAIRVITFDGEEYTTEEGYSDYRLHGPRSNVWCMALHFARGSGLYPTDYLEGTTADDLIAIAEKEIAANPDSPIVGFWRREIEMIRENW